jgi:histidinol-phosphate aminotransferase
VCATRNRVQKALGALGFGVTPSQANFIFASPPEASKTGPDFLAALRDRGILVRHFNQPEIRNHLRITIGSDEDMDTFLAACKDIAFGSKS